MTQKEIDKLRVINQTIDQVITIRTAAELLNLSERQGSQFTCDNYVGYLKIKIINQPIIPL